MLLTPDLLFSIANPLALLGWAMLVLAPGWRFTRMLVLSGVWSLGLAAIYAGLITAHYLGAHGGASGFGSLAQVAALFQDPWALLAGWVHYLCFDLFTGAWEVRDAQRRGVPHAALVPALALTFLFGPVGLLGYFGVRRLFGQKPFPQPAIIQTYENPLAR
ncbi:ABA4-like family protein [Hymenobacter baengnokdamensis]|uniref:ABA4-like family protein n=1 Tax=Hymenobacter baengnokdamensis TaxID=2615203 RepID=UPI001246EFCB|nr:ABA4-like family protein [Hymenobacter baengnokdamensis]